MLRISDIFLSIVILAFSTIVCAQSQTPPVRQPALPDFSSWQKTADHSSTLIYKGQDTQVRDIHYEHDDANQENVVFVFYNPDTHKEWFAVWNHQSRGSKVEAYLYEPVENGIWVFVKFLDSDDGADSVFKSRYSLEAKKQ